MQGFESSFRRHLAVEQRRAILEAIAETLDPDATVGEVLDAAERLGLGEQIGAFSLAEIAAAMVGNRSEAPVQESRPAGGAYEDDEDDAFEEEIADEDEDDTYNDEPEGEEDDALEDEYAEDDDDEIYEDEQEDEDEDEYTRNLRVLLGPEKLRELQRADDPPAPVKLTKTTKKGSKKKGSKKKASASAKTTSKKVEPVVVAKPSKAEDGRKRAARLRALRKKIDTEERMSLDEAAELFLPIVTELGQATMQDLEEFTGVGRRKLRFHVGQLVRHEYLARHGMGRGTYYTAG